MREQTAVGDLNSNEQGTGARKNEGKDPLELIPVRVWHLTWSQHYTVPAYLDSLLIYLINWQEQAPTSKLKDGHLVDIMLTLFSVDELEDAAKVFEFGAKKYKEWNWAKGMNWSVPTGCILRHIRSILEGDDIDPDSGLPHMGHIVCNLIMLSWYARYYKEGDNRPPIYKNSLDTGPCFDV